MKDYKMQVSEGFKDTYGRELRVKRELESIILKTFRSHGLTDIKTPMVEYIDVYSYDGLQKPDLYNLINRQGEVLSLLNDMTSSIARFVASNKISEEETVKYSYVAETFRYPRLYQGKKHQFLQAGIELISKNTNSSDLECIYIASALLKECGVKSFRLHIGSVAFINTLLDEFNVGNCKDMIYEAISRRDYVLLRSITKDAMSADNHKLFMDMIMCGGRVTYITGLIEKLEGYKKAQAELKYLLELYNTLSSLGIDLLFDFTIYSTVEYYTGIVFEVYLDGISKALLSGGRCDNMFKKFGLEFKNVGFGLDVDALTDYAILNDTIHVDLSQILCAYSSNSFIVATAKAEEIRKTGKSVYLMEFNSKDELNDYLEKNSITDYIDCMEVEVC